MAQLHRLLAMMDVALEAAAETTENVFAKSQVNLSFNPPRLGPPHINILGILCSYSGKDEETATAVLQQDTGSF